MNPGVSSMSKTFNMATKFVCALAITSLLTACGGTHLVKGESPLVSISSLTLDGDTLSTNFDIRNPNGVRMSIERVEVGISITDNSLDRANTPFDISIDPNSVEHIQVASKVGNATMDLFGQLEDGDILSLAYELDGVVHTLNEGIEHFSHEGHLYPVPGRPGYFRGAGANTPREDQKVRYDD